MNRKNEIRKELEEIAPFLAEVRKEKSGFGIPDNYFKEMQGQVFQQLNESPDTSAPAPSIFQKLLSDSLRTIQLLMQPRYVLRLAGFALAITAAVYFLQMGDQKSGNEFLAGISAEEVTAYVDNHIDEFELDVVLEVADLEAAELYSDPIPSNEALDKYIDEIMDDFDLEELEEML